VPENLLELLGDLERLAAYDGPWRALRAQTPRLRLRTAELRERAQRLDDVLVVALVGGSGVGKSTLLNAIAGDQIAATSEMRPCTAEPMVYHPPGVHLTFPGWPGVARSALDHLVLIDTPDSDTIVHHHRALVDEVLAQADLILLCGSPEKYLDEATWSLLRPLQGLRTLVCVETKAHGPDSVQEHWLGHLREQGFAPAGYFRVNALHAFDRRMRGGGPGVDEFDFPALENFLRQELTRERIARIKRSNVSGLLARTADDLRQCAAETEPRLDPLRAQLREAEQFLATQSAAIAWQRLLDARHLWVQALRHEMSLNAKGFMGTLFRIGEGLRGLPARLPGLFSAATLRGHEAPGTPRAWFGEALAAAVARMSEEYRARQSAVALALTQAGFDAPAGDDGLHAFADELGRRLDAVLSGPARDRLTQSAHRLTSWPMCLLADALPVAFVLYAGYHVVRAYFEAPLLPTSFFFHTAALLFILTGAELAAWSLAARLSAWWIRRRSFHDVRAAVAAPGLALAPERAILENTTQTLTLINHLSNAITSEP
jgi:energy-coupling factor transporter ATP-binding protein EcfA2